MSGEEGRPAVVAPGDWPHHRVPLTPAEPARTPVDLDRVQELITAVGGFLLYVVGVIGGAWALGSYFAPWVGFLLLMAGGLPPSVFSLRKAAERRAEKDRHVQLLASREPSRAVEIPRLD